LTSPRVRRRRQDLLILSAALSGTDPRITTTASCVDSDPDQALHLYNRHLQPAEATSDDSSSLHEWLHGLSAAWRRSRPTLRIERASGPFNLRLTSTLGGNRNSHAVDVSGCGRDGWGGGRRSARSDAGRPVRPGPLGWTGLAAAGGAVVDPTGGVVSAPNPGPQAISRASGPVGAAGRSRVASRRSGGNAPRARPQRRPARPAADTIEILS
jgi:hypothetical protein